MGVNQVLENNSIGEILLQYKKITESGIKQAVALQQKEGIYFGEAVVKLGLASKEDVEFAIASQFSHHYVEAGSVSKELLAAYAPFAPKVDGIRSVRTSLLLSGAGTDLKNIAILGEGTPDAKTFLSSNLAIVFAQLGHKTLLVDFDFRNPTVHDLFQVKNSCGMSSLLINRATIQEAIQNTSFEKLQILTSGPVPPNPLELAARPEARQIMDTLTTQYDITIVNIPLLEYTADVTSLSSFMDSVIMVVTENKTRKNTLAKTKNTLEEARAKLLGIVLHQN